ncbi:MAG: hypothetical protein LBS50_09815 [Prevotellaceae bacterium]|jgi:hypothetical protein|nr:hypothetical protein [Prevotellaceae bacterium]
MKKLLLIFSILLIVCATNAQVFVGGSIGVGFSNEKDENGEKYSQNFSLNFTPEVGYSINGKIDVGLDLGFGYQREKGYFLPNSDDINVIDTYSWNAALFVQYHFAKWKNFEFIGRGITAFGGNIFSTNVLPYYYNFSIYPIIQYNLNEHFILFTNLNFISLNVGGNFIVEGVRDFAFSFGADAGNVLNFSAIRIGFIYKF